MEQGVHIERLNLLDYLHRSQTEVTRIGDDFLKTPCYFPCPQGIRPWFVLVVLRDDGKLHARSKTRDVIAGLVPALSTGMAQRPIIEMDGTSTAMTKRGLPRVSPLIQPIDAERTDKYPMRI
jgi:hypothetical protein